MVEFGIHCQAMWMKGAVTASNEAMQLPQRLSAKYSKAANWVVENKKREFYALQSHKLSNTHLFSMPQTQVLSHQKVWRYSVTWERNEPQQFKPVEEWRSIIAIRFCVLNGFVVGNLNDRFELIKETTYHVELKEKSVYCAAVEKINFKNRFYWSLVSYSTLRLFYLRIGEFLKWLSHSCIYGPFLAEDVTTL